MPDPFTQIHSAIWSSLTASPAWAALVRPGNRIDMTDPRFQQIKPDASGGDTPEVMLLQGEFLLQPFGVNSQVASGKLTFNLAATTDVLSVVPINSFKLQTLAALYKAGPTLGLNGLVRSFIITGGRDGDEGGKFTRESKRWVSMLSIVVEFYIPAVML